MNQRILAHFETLVNEKYFGFSFQPVITNFEDLFQAIESFKSHVENLNKLALEAEAKKREEESAAQQEPAVESVA